MSRISPQPDCPITQHEHLHQQRSLLNHSHIHFDPRTTAYQTTYDNPSIISCCYHHLAQPAYSVIPAYRSHLRPLTSVRRSSVNSCYTSRAWHTSHLSAAVDSLIVARWLSARTRSWARRRRVAHAKRQQTSSHTSLLSLHHLRRHSQASTMNPHQLPHLVDSHLFVPRPHFPVRDELSMAVAIFSSSVCIAVAFFIPVRYLSLSMSITASDAGRTAVSAAVSATRDVSSGLQCRCCARSYGIRSTSLPLLLSSSSHSLASYSPCELTLHITPRCVVFVY